MSCQISWHDMCKIVIIVHVIAPQIALKFALYVFRSCPWNRSLIMMRFHQIRACLTHWGWDKIRCHFIDDIFMCIFLNENVWISLKISLKFIPKVRINQLPALIQILAWCRPGNKLSYESMMISLLMHSIYITQLQWVKGLYESTYESVNHQIVPRFLKMAHAIYVSSNNVYIYIYMYSYVLMFWNVLCLSGFASCHHHAELDYI